MLVRVPRGEHLPGPRVLDEVGRGVHRRRCCGRRRGERERGDEDCETSHRRRSFWPMNSEVDFTFGFSRWIVATGTPDFDEMTPKGARACTVQNRGRALVVVVPRGVVCDVTVFCGCVTTADVVVGVDEPACRPERMSRMAIVAAS